MNAAPLVVSLLAESYESLGRALAGGAAEGADLVEFRLDHLAGEVQRDPAGLRALTERAACPVIAAVHGEEGFGGFRGDAAARRELLVSAAAAGAAYVDVDERFADPVGEVGAPRIISTHRGAESVAELEGLAARLDQLAVPDRDLVKLAPAATDARQGIALLAWLEGRPARSTIALATGEAGAFTRLLAPAFGGVFTYAAPTRDGGEGLRPAAPGQLTVDHVRAIWPGQAPTQETDLALVCGAPIGHSAGPVVHGAALAAAGVDGVLAPTLAPPAAALALAPRLRGLSVTAPYKVEAMGLVPESSAAARALGALNTIEVGDLGAERGSNTDAPAIRAALEASGAPLEGAVALVLGAGGAARAAVHALRDAGATITVAARRLDAAADLGPDHAITLEALGTLAAPAPSVIVHATPLGTGGLGVVPVPDELLAPGVVVLDAVYCPRRTALLRRAESRGAMTVEGAQWFLRQAWLQHLKIFRRGYLRRFGEEGPPAEVREAAMAAMERALGHWLGREGR